MNRSRALPLVVAAVMTVMHHQEGAAAFVIGARGPPVTPGPNWPSTSRSVSASTSAVCSRRAATAAATAAAASSNIGRKTRGRRCGVSARDNPGDEDQQQRQRRTQRRPRRRPERPLAAAKDRPTSSSTSEGGGSCLRSGRVDGDVLPASASGGASLSRRALLKSTAAGVVAGFLAGPGLAGFTAVGVPAAANAEAEQQQQGEGALEEYSSPDGSFALRYPASFKGFSKPLKTHKVEVNFKSEEVKGFEVGVAIDPVRIESLETFGTPEEVGARVLKVEQGKDGTLDTKLFDTRAEKQGDLSLYTLDYFVESTRGFKHFVAKVTIKDNLLYACTAQAKEKDYPMVEEQLKKIVDSFRVPA
ncbi:unnamed protein product [Scytosiphon promiscuus]